MKLSVIGYCAIACLLFWGCVGYGIASIIAHKPALTCYDRAGYVTTGDNYKLCTRN